MNTTSSTLDKSYKSNDYITLYDQKITIPNDNIKTYSPLSSETLWELYEIVSKIYEVPLSPTIIHKVRDKKTKKLFALKELRKAKLNENYQHEFARNEIIIHYSMSKLSDLVVQVPHYFEDSDSYYFVLEYSHLHEYFDYLLEKVTF